MAGTDALTLEATTVGTVAVLTARGRLDSTTYRSLRDRIIRAALDEPTAVLVDASRLAVPAESAWTVFTSAQWHVGRWPGVPIMLVCDDAAKRAAIARSGVARQLTVFARVDDARAALSTHAHRTRRGARASLPALDASVRRSRDFVDECLTAWSRSDLIPVAKVIVTTFVENVLQHTKGPPGVRLEASDGTVTVAVEDDSRTPPLLLETQMAADVPTGLKIVGALCRAWGSAPTPSGKTVWAVIGPENRL